MLQSQDPKKVLEEFFGFKGFKGTQEAIVNSVLRGEDCFVIMPTGAGKSLCYQLPAIMLKGTAIIISPLIALMKNQVDQLRGFAKENSLAHFMNSSLNKSELELVKEDILSGATKILYIAPETLKKEETIEFFKRIKISFVAVDEAHCISEWGHDFRPEYRRIKEMVKAIDDVSIIALTATATPKVQGDIQKNLGMQEAEVYKSSFNRDNLYYEVQAKGNRERVAKRIISYISKHKGKSGIVYCLSRKKVEEIAELLKVNGVKALPYHAGMDAKTRAAHQDAFLMEDTDVIVATIAFGMGIDKPDVRFVIHHDVPKSLEGYYQETGRAGRDGMQGECILMYNPYDTEKLEKFMKDKSVAEREIGTQLIAEMSAFAESGQCRRKFILNYFGEEFPEERCNKMCDNCKSPKERVEVKDELQMALKVLVDLKGEFVISHVTDFMIGKKSDSIKDYQHEKLPYFACGKEKDKLFWKSIFRLALLHGYIAKNIEKYGLLSVNKKGLDYVKNPISHPMAVDTEFEKIAEEEEDNSIIESIADPVLLAQLKGIRKSVAKKMELPPYVIFSEPSLDDMASKYPITIEELEKINGVGKNKAVKFGKEFLEFIAKYVKENDIEREDEVVVKSVADKSGKKISIILNLDKKVPLEDIAKGNGMTYEELLEEMEHIVNSGTKLSLNHCIDDMMDKEFQEEVYEYFMETMEDDLDAAVAEFEGEVTYEEFQILRLQFLSDKAN
jgi:ATP-dependent DNA helicase RecQ